MQIFGRETEYKRELEEYITIVVLAPILFGRTVLIYCLLYYIDWWINGMG